MCVQMSPEDFRLYSTSEDYFICMQYHVYLLICTSSESLPHRDMYDVISGTSLPEIVESLPSSPVDSLLTDVLTPVRMPS